MAQPVTGVQRYGRELLAAFDALLDAHPGPVIRLLTPIIPDGSVPALRHMRHEMIGRRQGHAWEQLDLPRHIGDAVLFCPGNTAPILSLMGAGRVVVTVHDLSYLYFPDAYSRAFKLLYNRLIPLIMRRADQVITVSQTEQAAITGHYPCVDGRLAAIQNGGLPFGIEKQAPTPNETPTVLYVGSLSKRKNFPGMLDVAIRLARSHGINFEFVGSVPQGLSATIADVPPDVRKHLRFYGQINDWDQLLDLYRSATCFLFPSFYEASPLPPIEAMGCGCPVIAGDIPSLRERCGNAALYCDPASVDAISAAVRLLIDDPALRQRMCDAGYERAQQYSWIHCAKETLGMILGARSAA